MSDFQLPPASCLKWVNPGNRPPLPPYPVISCRRLFAAEDIAEAERLDAARKVAYPNGPSVFGWDDRDVYFITGEGAKNVKIGRATNYKMDHRLAALQTGSPVKLSIMMVINCHQYESSLSIELRIHEMFKEYRVHGEWFKIEGRLLEFLKWSGVEV